MLVWKAYILCIQFKRPHRWWKISTVGIYQKLEVVHFSPLKEGHWGPLDKEEGGHWTCWFPGQGLENCALLTLPVSVVNTNMTDGLIALQCNLSSIYDYWHIQLSLSRCTLPSHSPEPTYKKNTPTTINDMFALHLKQIIVSCKSHLALGYINESVQIIYCVNNSRKKMQMRYKLKYNFI